MSVLLFFGRLRVRGCLCLRVKKACSERLRHGAAKPHYEH